MQKTCLVCNTISFEVINLSHYPYNVHFMLDFVLGYQSPGDDDLCNICYAQLINAYNFKQKWHQSKMNKAKSPAEDRVNKNDKNDTLAENEIIDSLELAEVKIEPMSDSEENSITNADLKQNMDESIDSCANDQNKDEAEGSKEIIRTLRSGRITKVKDVQEKDTSEPEDDETTFECEMCKQTFTKSDSLRKHMRRKHYFGERRDNKIRRGPVPRYNENDIFGNLKETQCEFCYNIFSDVKELQDHEKQHKEEERPYRCNKPDCEARFKHRYRARTHIINHAGEKRYQCRYCDKRFQQSSNLKTHERSHTGEKPYLCSHCGKGCASNKRLIEHIRIHTGEQPFECSVCGKCFNRSETLRIHEKSHTGVKPFQCTMCSSAFVNKGRLVQHLKIHFPFPQSHSIFRVDGK